eukprot:767083-Hanusia_phi.AAC.15
MTRPGKGLNRASGQVARARAGRGFGISFFMRKDQAGRQGGRQETERLEIEGTKMIRLQNGEDAGKGGGGGGA